MTDDISGLHDATEQGVASAGEYAAAARQYLQQRDLKAAVQQLAGAIAREPNHGPSHALLWEVLGASRDPEILLRLSGDVFFGLAAIRALHCARRGRRTEALALLGRLVNFRPEKPFVSWARDWEGAEPSPPDALAAFIEACSPACVESSAGDAVENLRCLLALLEVSRQRAPDHAGLLLAQVRLYRAVGAPERAVGLAAQDQTALSAELANELAKAYFDLGDEEHEALWLERSERSAATLCRLAELKLLGGDSAAALTTLEDAPDEDASLRLRDVARALASRDAARQVLESLLAVACEPPPSAVLDAAQKLLGISDRAPTTRLRVIAETDVSPSELSVVRALTSADFPGLELEWRFDDQRGDLRLADWKLPRAVSAEGSQTERALWQQCQEDFVWSDWVRWGRDSPIHVDATQIPPQVFALDPEHEVPVDSQAMGQLVGWGLLVAFSAADVSTKLEILGGFCSSADAWVARGAVVGLAALSEFEPSRVATLVAQLLGREEHPPKPACLPLLASLALALGATQPAKPRLARALLAR